MKVHKTGGHVQQRKRGLIMKRAFALKAGFILAAHGSMVQAHQNPDCRISGGITITMSKDDPSDARPSLLEGQRLVVIQTQETWNVFEYYELQGEPIYKTLCGGDPRLQRSGARQFTKIYDSIECTYLEDDGQQYVLTLAQIDPLSNEVRDDEQRCITRLTEYLGAMASNLSDQDKRQACALPVGETTSYHCVYSWTVHQLRNGVPFDEGSGGGSGGGNGH